MRSVRAHPRLPLIAVATLAAGFHMADLRAQEASNNPLASAQDAFGLTLGLESIGLYGPGGVRGFSPQAAGNVRIEGLYFDEQGALSNRVIAGSTIRVGLSEIGYAFPAPTGIVDYELRDVGDGKPGATVIANAGPYQARGISIDGSVPLAGKALLLPFGASTQVSTQTSGFGPSPGYTSTVTSAGATPQWSPNARVTVRGLFDWQETRNAKTFPLYLTAGDFLPPPIGDAYQGQDWARGRSLTENFGGLVAARLSRQWSLKAGLFRSIADNPLSFADLYTNIEPNGRSEHLVVAFPDQRSASTSGELRLTGRFAEGDWHHELILLARGRDVLARYGGEDTVDVGAAAIGAGLQVPEPAFTYSMRTNDRTELWSVGTAYHVEWRGLAELEAGIQDEHYRKAVASPGVPASRLSDHPLRAYANSAVEPARFLTLYAGYTQGLEDSGIAPNNARNGGAVLPASRTWQFDSGLRYLATRRLNVIADVYEIHKPYFNLDTGNVDRDLGVQQAKGVELSISGHRIAHLDVNVGIAYAKVSIIGNALAAAGVGPVAIGQPRLQYTANLNYTLPGWPVASLDLAAVHFGSAPGSVDNRVYVPPITELSLGGRYRFTVLGRSSTLRVQIQNVADSYWWTAAYTPGYFPSAGPRTVFAYVTTYL
jgi:iron complex outermembrane recepter protein